MTGFRKRLFSLGTLLFCGTVGGWANAASVPQIGFIANKDGFVKPERVSVAPGGVMYVTDAGTEELTILDSDGSKTGSVSGTGVPRGVKVLPNGNILVGYSSESGGFVSLYSSSGSFIKFIGDGVGQFSMPTSITIDPSTGTIYVADSVRNLVYMFDGGGNYLNQFGGYGYLNNQFDYPAGIVFDGARREVLVADQGNYRVKVFDTNGNFLRKFGSHAPDSSWLFGDARVDLLGKFSKIQGITVDSQSRVYIVDSFQCAVQVYDSVSGVPLAVFGDYGKGDGQLKTPVDVALDNQNRLILADWNNNRLAFFQIEDGTPPVNTAPATPSPISPLNGAQVGALSLVLTAANATDEQYNSLRYVFQMDTVASFSSPSLVETVVPQGVSYTNASVAAPADHAAYFWRVKAVEFTTSQRLESPWSTVSTFYVNASNRAPSAPSNPAPASGSTLNSGDSLSWSASSDPDLYDTVSYTLEVSTDSGFSSLVDSRTGIGSTSISLSQISKLISGSYYWRVKAVDNHGMSSAYSTTNSFTFGVTTLRVSTTPAGAVVWLDGNYGYLGYRKGITGATPLNIDVKPGRHVVRLQLAGYFEYYGTVDLPAGQSQTVSVTLTPKYTFSLADRGDMTADGDVKIGSSGVSIMNSAPFAVDWDNDGRKDLLVGDYSGAVYLFSSTGSDASPSLSYARNIADASGEGAYPWVVDWDNDGRKDLLVGTRTGVVRLYLNTGTESAPVLDAGHLVLADGNPVDAGTYARPVVVDWNNDGRKDLLVGGYDGASGFVRLYLNFGTDDAPMFGDYTDIMVGSGVLTVSGPAMPVVHDWNQDGRKDLIVGGGQGVYLYTNTGTDASPAFSSKSSISSASGSLTSLPYAVPFVLDWDNTTPPDILVGNSSGAVRMFKK